MINGRQLARNLGIEIQGTPPRRLSERGDAAFERSRSEALFALHKFEIELKSRRSAEELIQTIHEIRTGERIGEIPLDDCAGKWAELPRRQPLAERYLSWAQKTIARFFAYVRASHHGIRQMSQVQVRMARAFMRDEEKRGVAAATYNKNLILLRSVFEALRREAGMAENPFAGIPTRDGESIFRKPFSVEELGLIVKAGETDSFIQPLIITGMCTAMRKGDCCTLLRSDVDFAGGFVSVKTSKTGESIEIPIFPLFRETLKKALAEPTTRAPFYVFPDLEAHYKNKPDHLTAGVPMEVVRKVTGHRTAEIVMKHYFQPGREEFRRTLAAKLPPLLGARSESEMLKPTELYARMGAMTPETWEAIRDELMARLPSQSTKVVEIAALPPAVFVA
jgi:integrase